MMPDAEQWRLMADLVLIICSSVALLALAGLPVMCLAGQNLARIRQRSSYDKCARQLAVCAMLLGWLLLVAGAVLVWLRVQPLLNTENPLGQDGVTAAPGLAEQLLSTVQAQADVLTWLLLLCAVLLVSLYASLWRTLRESPTLHQVLGVLGTALCYWAVFAVMALVSADAAVELGEPLPSTLTAIFMPPQTSSLWNGVSYLLPLSLSMAGGLASWWLLLRRQRDDYGRDHYAQMLPWCAVWARNSWIVLWMLLVGLTGINLWYTALDNDIMPMSELIRPAARLLLWIIPGLLWTIVARSAAPLRHKFTLILAMILASAFVIPVYMGLISDI